MSGTWELIDVSGELIDAAAGSNNPPVCEARLFTHASSYSKRRFASLVPLCQSLPPMNRHETFEGNTFAGGELDRAGHLRRDDKWYEAQITHADARFLPLWHLKALVNGSGLADLVWLDYTEIATEREQDACLLLLGLDDKRIPHFAIDVSARAAADGDAPFADKGEYFDLRPLAPRIRRPDAALLAQARSMIDWHARHGFCSVCGKATLPDDGGYVRRCTDDACKAQHFPRTDPVVIMLVTNGDRALMGRQNRFPSKMFSALAGFVEPGETVEEAVRREVMEEAGIEVGTVRYHSSQPWPYPSSLMIGCLAEAISEKITVDPLELESAYWFSRKDLTEAMEESLKGGLDPFNREMKSVGEHDLLVPHPMAIAHQLIRAWIELD